MKNVRVDLEKLILLSKLSFINEVMEPVSNTEVIPLPKEQLVPLAKLENKCLTVLYHIMSTEKSCWETMLVTLKGNQAPRFLLRVQNGMHNGPLPQDSQELLNLVRQRLVELGLLEKDAWDHHI